METSTSTAVVNDTEDVMAEEVATPIVNVNKKGLAIHGFDAVAYFKLGEPRKGVPEHEVTWGNARWRFINEEHSTLFLKTPEKYLPAYGGFCAFAVVNGTVADADPKAWCIIQDRLFLNYNMFVRSLWNIKRDKIVVGDQKWLRMVTAGKLRPKKKEEKIDRRSTNS